MITQHYCQDCKQYRPWTSNLARDTPKCKNPDGMVFVRVLNNCQFFEAKA